MLFLLKLVHLRFICGVETDAKISWICIEVCRAPTRAATLALLSQYQWAGREVFQRDLLGFADMMHIYGALFMFVHGDRFVNLWHDMACTAGGV